MKNKCFFHILVSLFFFPGLYAQSDYNIGSASVSIEPDSTLFSVALSGYGFPAEGRFSIEWLPHGNIPDQITSITGVEGKFYAADSNKVLWRGTPSGDNFEWENIGVANDILALAGLGERLFAVKHSVV